MQFLVSTKNCDKIDTSVIPKTVLPSLFNNKVANKKKTTFPNRVSQSKVKPKKDIL